ncbi:hypothetical protein ABZ478_19910 [Streptomyces sp. NPDC005706]|uniref:hypothetical protein n=1 Tax=Streptomyces sp. NPDC005706 TaxID=3157169 RepID=UPI0033DC3243
MQLPSEDRVLSPYIGWSKAHWEAAANGLLSAVQPYAGHSLALIKLPGSRPAGPGGAPTVWRGT